MSVRTGVNPPQFNQRQKLNVSALVLAREEEDKDTGGASTLGTESEVSPASLSALCDLVPRGTK